MKNFLFFFIVVFGISGNVHGQDLDQYHYVQVPQEFEFLSHENQYNLNALTAFLFEKYGFEVLYQDDVPANVDLCDVLKANVHDDSGFFRSKLYVTLENCRNKVVFTSEKGVSREKDFQRSYHEALRKAFTSFEELRNNPEVIIDPVPESEIAKKNNVPAEVIIDPVPTPAGVGTKNPEIIVDPVVTSEEIEEATEENYSTTPEVGEDLPQFLNGAVTYTLKRTPSGFELYREGEGEKFGTLFKSGQGENYLYSSKGLSGNAFFDTRGNLVVEYLDPNTQQLVSVIYQRRDQ